jgi:hypothetical protein
VQPSSCQHCGADNPPTNRFCHECGHALTEGSVLAHHAPREAPLPDEVEDSANWQAYADREWHQQSDLQAALRDYGERRPVRIVLVAGTILAAILIALFLSVTPRQALRWPARQGSIAPSAKPSIASGPLEPEPRAPTDQPHSSGDAAMTTPPPPDPAVTTPQSPGRLETVRQEEPPALPRQPGSGSLPSASEPPGTPPTPRTAVERMARFLIARDGPEGAVQTALAVAEFYPVNTDAFKYWQGVATAIRASTASREKVDSTGN